MMKFVCQLTKKFKVKTMVSLNPVMIDGTGMCGGCRVKVDNKTAFCCVDGLISTGILSISMSLSTETTFTSKTKKIHYYSQSDKYRPLC